MGGANLNKMQCSFPKKKMSDVKTFLLRQKPFRVANQSEMAARRKLKQLYGACVAQDTSACVELAADLCHPINTNALPLPAIQEIAELMDVPTEGEDKESLCGLLEVFRQSLLVSNPEASRGNATPNATRLLAYECPVLGGHTITFVNNAMYYQTKARSGMQPAEQPIFDLFRNMWFQCLGFSEVSKREGTRTLQKYAWDDEFLLHDAFEANLPFFVSKIVAITGCVPADVRARLVEFCETYSTHGLSKTDVLSVLLRTLAKSHTSPESWRLAVFLSKIDERRPTFYNTSLGQLFWRLVPSVDQTYTLDILERPGPLLPPEMPSLDNAHFVLISDLLVNPTETFVDNDVRNLPSARPCGAIGGTTNRARGGKTIVWRAPAAATVATPIHLPRQAKRAFPGAPPLVPFLVAVHRRRVETNFPET
jgi:hypothetical protein